MNKSFREDLTCSLSLLSVSSLSTVADNLIVVEDDADAHVGDDDVGDDADKDVDEGQLLALTVMTWHCVPHSSSAAGRAFPARSSSPPPCSPAETRFLFTFILF